MQHWNSYWQNTKTLNSFAEGEQGLGYKGEIAQFWQQVFTAQNATAKILDLATGNGALAVLALQYNERFEVSASDQADIMPLKLFNEQDEVYPLLKKVSFYGNMPSEQLGFADEQFDLVISQFGFEYAQPELALQQVFRVLKPGGNFTALIHHSDSFITEDCRQGMRVLQHFMATDGLLTKVKAFATYCQQLAGVSSLQYEQQQELKQRSNKLLQTFIALQRELSEAQQDWFSLLAKDVVAVISNWRSLSVQAVDTLQRNMADFNQRLSDQVASAWSSDLVSRIIQTCNEFWSDSEVSCLSEQEGKLCWVLKLKK